MAGETWDHKVAEIERAILSLGAPTEEVAA
jgi:hypothetical protein